MKKWIFVTVLIVALAGSCFFVFREQLLIPDGYVIEYIGNSFTITDSNSKIAITDYVPGRTIVQYNHDFPDSVILEEFTIDSKELEAILKTARCRLSLKNSERSFSDDAKYQFAIPLKKDDKIRAVRLTLGKNSRDDGGMFTFEILNAEDIIYALDTAESMKSYTAKNLQKQGDK